MSFGNENFSITYLKNHEKTSDLDSHECPIINESNFTSHNTNFKPYNKI